MQVIVYTWVSQNFCKVADIRSGKKCEMLRHLSFASYWVLVFQLDNVSRPLLLGCSRSLCERKGWFSCTCPLATGELVCREAGVNLKGRGRGRNNSYIMSSWLRRLSAGVKRSGMPFWNAVAAISRATGDHSHTECWRLKNTAGGTTSKFSKNGHPGSWMLEDWPGPASGDRMRLLTLTGK